jgi:hypothetical protein
MSGAGGNKEEGAFTVTGSRFQFVCEDMVYNYNTPVLVGNTFPSVGVGCLGSEVAVVSHSDYREFLQSVATRGFRTKHGNVVQIVPSFHLTNHPLHVSHIQGVKNP